MTYGGVGKMRVEVLRKWRRATRRKSLLRSSHFRGRIVYTRITWSVELLKSAIKKPVSISGGKSNGDPQTDPNILVKSACKC
jgi:hypothetical protein